jgi:hypothetical protein
MRVGIAAWFHPYPHQHERFQCAGRIVPGRDGETVYGLVGFAHHVRAAKAASTRRAFFISKRELAKREKARAARKALAWWFSAC